MEKMTSIELAQVGNKTHADLLKAIRKMEKSWVKIGQGNFALSSYINDQSRAMPIYELSKAETLYIATKFNDEARAKLVVRWQELEEEKSKPMSTLDMVQASIDAIRKQNLELEEHDNRLKLLEAKTTTRPDYFTIAGYGTLIGVPVNIALASRLGRQASSICRQKDIPTDKIPDARFGLVKMYPKEVLASVFQQKADLCKV